MCVRYTVLYQSCPPLSRWQIHKPHCTQITLKKKCLNTGSACKEIKSRTGPPPTPSLSVFFRVFNKLVTQETGKLMKGMHLWLRKKKTKRKRKEGGKIGENGREKKVGSSTRRIAWPEFSTCPRAAVVLPLQHAALQCVCSCVHGLLAHVCVYYLLLFLISRMWMG